MTQASAVPARFNSTSTAEYRPTALFAAEPPLAPTDRHWFVPDRLDGFYCAACGLPRLNRRHTPHPDLGIAS